jgi:hypothetical protein
MRSRAPPVADAARRQGLRLAEEDEKPGSQGESVGLRLAEALGNRQKIYVDFTKYGISP